MSIPKHATVNVRSSRLKGEQRRLLFQAVSARPKLLLTKLSPQFTAHESHILWAEVAAEVNASGSGAPKSGEQWQKTWNDMRRAVQKKNLENQQSLQRTGGGPLDIKPLSDLEEAILGFFGGTTPNGDETIAVPHIGLARAATPAATPTPAAPDRYEYWEEEREEREDEWQEHNLFMVQPVELPNALLQPVATTQTAQQLLNKSLSPGFKRKRLDEPSPAKKAAQDLGAYQGQLLQLQSEKLKMQREMHRENFEMQRENFEMQREMQREMHRENLEMQRTFFQQKLELTTRKVVALEKIASLKRKHFE